MTADPRDTVRQWLADTMCADLDIDLDKPSCRRCLAKADAIVNHRGVEVCEEVPGFDVEPGHRVPMYRVVTIRLPVQPIGGSGG